MITIIVAIAENNAIGLNNRLLYTLPNDMQHFKQITTGHTVLMGRKTFLSLPTGPLKNRRNIVLSRCGKPIEGVDVFKSLNEALDSCSPEEEIFIIGGAEIYRKTLPIADSLQITLVHDTPPEADTFFPNINYDNWKVVKKEHFKADSKHPFAYTFITYKKK
ncbi:MAG TPA: dihydrofolate reductase [Bacteroidaceae bacterium]|nr:dihydrofolate reductase [Bacteroidaceae bacterium]